MSVRSDHNQAFVFRRGDWAEVRDRSATFLVILFAQPLLGV